MTAEGKEFDLIRRLFAPLTSNRPEALGLLDDAAILSPTSDTDLAITTDTLVAGVHFREHDPPEAAAARCLRSNLSDLAAMGAEPDCYTLAIGLPKGLDESWMQSFANQLAADHTRFAIDLIGGDTVSTPGPFMATITALGRIPTGQGIQRSTAIIGDDVYVTGTIGDAALGLSILNGTTDGLGDDVAAFLKDRFWYPSPRTTLGPQLRGLASAMADVSDGLIADLGHICRASRVSAQIHLSHVPLSTAARHVTAEISNGGVPLLSGGDDYELVFTASPDNRPKVEQLGVRGEVPITRIGEIKERDSDAVKVIDDDGGEISQTGTGGYQHDW